MIEEGLEAAKRAYERGNYALAHSLARTATPRTKRERDDRDCLVCECLQYKGEFETALERATVALRSDLTAELTARYWEVVGRIKLDQLQRQESAEALRKAVRAAEKCSDWKLLAAVQQAWLITSAENLGAGLAARVREAYHTAVRSADPAVLAGFHLRLARLEGQRGTFLQALHHLNLAKSLLERCDNISLNALYHVNRSCVLGLTGSFDAARKSAEMGAALAEQAGNLRLALAGTANVAYVSLSAGDLSVADSWLRKARKTAKPLGAVEIGLLDSLAHLALVQGKYDEAETYLRETRRAFEAQELRWISSTEALNLFTELYLHKKRRNKSEYGRVLATIRAAAQSLNDKHSQRLVTLAEAEALFDEGSYDNARAKLRDFLAESPSYPVYRAESNRLLARDLWVDGHKSSARRRLLRATTTAYIRGSRMSWCEALREVNSLGEEDPWDIAYGLKEHSRLAESKFQALVTAPGAGWYQETAPSSIQPRDCVDGFDDAIAILEIGQDAELRAREALATAIALNVVSAGAVICRTDAGARTIAAYRWPKVSLEKATKEDHEIVRIDVGKVESKAIEVALKPAKGLRALTSVAGIRHLLEAAKAMESQKDQQRLGALWQPEIIIEEPDAVFSSPQMIELMTTARKVAATSLPVLLLGDTGTGKEVLARAIHRASNRANKIFLPFNCSAVPRDMIESQLFGYRRGSFTGAHVDFPGIIRSAEGGTLFLDEIGELSMDLQPKLLRFLETNEVHPLGEGKPIKVDVRVIAATNADLDDLIQLKEFREDLYYRLNIVRFHMPQLSERREEIPPLATHLLRRFEMDEKKHGIKLSDELMEYLLLYKWPGNVRQLSNELRKMVAMVGSNETLTPEHLAPAIRATRRTVPVDPDAEAAPAAPPEESRPDATALTMTLDQPLPTAVEALERAMIEHAMTRAEGRIEEAARLLGISRKGLFLKRRRWLDGGDTPSRPA